MASSTSADEGVVREVRLRGMRAAIATAMTASLQGSAQLTLNRDLDVSALVELRRGAGAGLSINTLMLAAVARVLARRPDVNATLEDKVIRQYSRVDVGFAVAIEEGLVVPVIRDADKLSAAQIGEQAAALAEKAHARSLAMDDLQDATFTVTNLGALGVDSFTPIINPPQVAILGVGRMRGTTITGSLTIDHRALDGAPGGRFLMELDEQLSAPESLLEPRAADGSADG